MNFINNKSIIIFLAFSVLMLGIANINSITTIKKQGEIITQVSEKAEDLNLKLESAVADKDKLSSYEESRKIEVLKIEEISNEIKTFQEAKRLRETMKDNLEKQIRCQRAVLSGLEKGQCDDESIFSKYPL